MEINKKIDKKGLKSLKVKTEKGFYIFNDYHEFIIIFEKKEKHLFINYLTIKYRGSCSTEKEAIETASVMLNKWINTNY